MSIKLFKRPVSPVLKKLVLFVGIIAAIQLCGGPHAFAAGTETDVTQSFFQQYFVYPFSVTLKTVAQLFQGNFGLSIIFVTLVLRLVLMPFMLKQTKQQLELKEKMAVLQPDLKPIQDKMKTAATKEEQVKYQQQLMALYQKHNVNPLSSVAGCLPILLQMPVLMGFYYAIRDTPEIASHSFLWFNLGQPDHILAIIAALVYLLQYKLSVIDMPEEQKKQMAVMGYISPIMMGFISFSAPAALPLYWTVGGIFLMFQSYLSKKIFNRKPALQEVNTAK